MRDKSDLNYSIPLYTQAISHTSQYIPLPLSYDRIDFLHRYLLELGKAIEEGTPIRGYLQWSFLDNFEWSSGYDERFGIVYVDYRTCERIPKESAAWYADVIATNGENL